ncbi:MAG: NAD-dependent epimerase/dehydratase family protein [Chitinophagaceae bacterium]|nr:MAG: NAD-dependent epimerase/dehydratase family protein [Chitinophagaceae bacterium]
MNKKRPIIVLGSKGMLGQMVYSYFSKSGFSLHEVQHRFDPKEREKFIDDILAYPDAIIINCIGKIKQKTDDENEILMVNTLLPLALKTHLLPTQTLVHPSTDCVYNGNAIEPYSIMSVPNAIDTYGWSKRLAEEVLRGRPNTIIFRVSIIGPDKNPEGKGLLAWFLNNNEGTKLRGYLNHLWNGITTLEWCKQIVHLLASKDLNDKTIFEIGGTSEYYNKCELLQLFQRTFNTKYDILPFLTPNPVNHLMIPTLISKNFEEQLRELKNYTL